MLKRKYRLKGRGFITEFNKKHDCFLEEILYRKLGYSKGWIRKINNFTLKGEKDSAFDKIEQHFNFKPGTVKKEHEETYKNLVNIYKERANEIEKILKGLK